MYVYIYIYIYIYIYEVFIVVSLRVLSTGMWQLVLSQISTFVSYLHAVSYCKVEFVGSNFPTNVGTYLPNCVP